MTLRRTVGASRNLFSTSVGIWGGVPPAAHFRDPQKSLKRSINSNWLALPKIAAQNDIEPEEIDAFNEYLDYSNFLAQFLIENPVL